MKKIIFSLLCFTVMLLVSGMVHADLVDNGNGTITDTDLNLMWLQDANYALTSGYDDDGRMDWNTAMGWADSLIFAGYDDWVLPVSDASCTDYNCTDSEMGHLYYEELGNSAGGPLNNTGPFVNLMPDAYWSGTNMDGTYAWDFRFNAGRQANYVFKDTPEYAIAVREIAVVPEPVSSLLFIAGGTLLGGRMYSKKKRRN